jgi:hypothetical protein
MVTSGSNARVGYRWGIHGKFKLKNSKFKMRRGEEGEEGGEM